MELSEEMRNFNGTNFPYREWADKVAQLEAENERLSEAIKRLELQVETTNALLRDVY